MVFLRKYLFLTIFLMVLVSGVTARQLLHHLDLRTGHWVMVGVSLHNYKILPIQEELGTFIVDDFDVLAKMKEEWVFEEKFEDFCDYHYALKFYRNGELVETLLANLHCNYITISGLSYHFNQEIFRKYSDSFAATKWSRIRFRDLDLLKDAVNKLELLRGVYWYGDVEQYNFKGNFMIGLDQIPWDANRDSLAAVVTDEISLLLNRSDFYVSVHCWYLSDDFEEMSIRFNVYCNQDFYKSYAGVRDDWMASWRNHFSEQSFVQIVVIGLSKKDYYQVMGD